MLEGKCVASRVELCSRLMSDTILHAQGRMLHLLFCLPMIFVKTLLLLQVACRTLFDFDLSFKLNWSLQQGSRSV